MRLFNQSKNQLGWSMGGQVFECEPWGSVDVPDELVDAAKSRGLPLATIQVTPEARAHVRLADERAVSDAAPLLALRKEADDAKALEASALRELEEMQAQLTKAQGDLREATELNEHLHGRLAAAASEKAELERLLSAANSQATAAEARAIKAEALHEKPKGKHKTEA